MSDGTSAGDDGVRLQLHTELDRAAIRRQRLRGARRPPRPSDRWWVIGAGVVSAAGWASTGFSIVWAVGVGAAVLFGIGVLVERTAEDRQLAEIPVEHRRRTISIGDERIRAVAQDGTVLVDCPWREVEAVDRNVSGYTIELSDGVIDLPVDAFPNELARGSFEALAARNDRPIHHGA